jgi:hypothetical protein
MGRIGKEFEAVYSVVSRYESDERLLETICREEGYSNFIDSLTDAGINYQIAKSYILPVLYFSDFPQFCAEVQKSDFGTEYKWAVGHWLSHKN